MSELRERIESALRQGFRAGWWYRDKKPNLLATVEERNVAEDEFMSVEGERGIASVLALLDSSEPVAKDPLVTDTSDPRETQWARGECAGCGDAACRGVKLVYACEDCLASPTPTPDPEGGEG